MLVIKVELLITENKPNIAVSCSQLLFVGLSIEKNKISGEKKLIRLAVISCHVYLRPQEFDISH